MIPVTVPNRPFGTDLITGLMLPDGVFEASLGDQRINAQLKNVGASAVANFQVYIESVSHPAIVVTPRTHLVPALGGGASRTLSWDADFGGVPPGIHQISFIAENASGRRRTIKKIFVTRIQFDPVTRTFSAQTPEGMLEVRFKHLIGPSEKCCGQLRRASEKGADERLSFVDKLPKLFRGHDPGFQFCPPGYLPLDFDVVITPTPPFAGQYGDLPYQDFWWKVLLCIIALILLIAAAIVASQEGGEITVVTDGAETPPGSPPDCCGVHAEGGSDSYVVAGLVAAAAAAATLAGLSDVRDPLRRGQDHTAPAPGELTVGERLTASIEYTDAVALGRSFAIGAKWEYVRITPSATYTYGANDVNTNTHVLSSYKITANDVTYRHSPWVVKGEFLDRDGKRLRGGDLLVQCFLVGPHGQFQSFMLQDDGIDPDEGASDGVYTGQFFFRLDHDPRGLWKYYVIAQDVNIAQPEMDPEEQAKIIGGMVVTHQLTIDFEGADCQFVPDGHVNVV